MKPNLLHIHERPLNLIKFNYDGDFFISCARDGEVNLVRTDTSERVGTYNPQGEKPGAVFAVDITNDNEYVVTIGADGRVVIFQFNGEQHSVLQHGGILKFVEFNQKPGAQNMIVTANDKFKSAAEGSIPNRICIWQWDPTWKKLLVIDESLPMKATQVKWGPFDETLISIHEEGTVMIWDSSDGHKMCTVEAHRGEVTSLNFTADRMLMITSSKDYTAKLWAMDQIGDNSEPEHIKTYTSDRPLNDACISPLYADAEAPKYHVLLGGGQDAKDVTTTAAAHGRFEALLWHMIFEEEIGTVKGHFGPINCLAWFRDGRGFVTGGEDGYIRVHSFDNDYFTKKAFE